MKPVFILFSFLMLTSLSSQQVNGLVLYLNSGGQAAEGVKISGLGCNSVYTMDDGFFILECGSKKPGQKVRLSIGNSDVDGKNIEVVNSNDLKLIRMPSDPDHEPFEIIVCEAGERDDAARRLYGILEKSNNRRIERKVNEITKKLDQQNLDNSVKANLLDQLDQLNAEKEEAYEKLELLSLELASINKDQASELVNQALNKIEQEQDIETALTILSEQKLEESYKEALENKEKLNKRIKSVIEGFKFKISLYESQFEYDTIAKYYDRIIEIHEENQFSKEELAELILAASKNLYDNGKFEKALKYQTKAASILEGLDENEKLLLGNTYTEIGLTYTELGDYNLALKNHQKAVSILKSTGDTISSQLAETYNNVGLVHQKLDNYEEALEFYFRCLNIEQNLDSVDLSDVSITNHNISLAYAKLDSLDLAIEYELRAIKQGEEILKPEDPQLAYFYSGLSSHYIDSKQLDKAQEYQLKAISIREKVLNSSHPMLAASYFKQGRINWRLRNLDKAVEYFLKAVKIGEESLKSDHPDLAAYYNSTGLVNISLKNYEQALDYLMKSLAIQETNENVSQGQLASIYSNIGIAYYKAGKYLEAESYQLKSLNIKKEIYEPTSSGVIREKLALCQTLPKVNKYEEAFEILEELDNLYPDNKFFYSYRVIVNACKGDFKKAREALSKAIEFGLTNPATILEDPCSVEIQKDLEFMQMINEMNRSE